MADKVNPLDTLRQAFNPKDDVKFELKVNEHPKGHTNKSIVNALNMKLSDDGIVLENDNAIEEVTTLTTKLSSYYTNKRKIVHILPCNKELVIFVARDMNVIETTGCIDIWRYNESTDNADIFYSKGIPWYGGRFSSTFTYTSNNSLIIAFCEYDSIGNKIYDCPLRTINLGDFGKSKDIFNDRDIEVYKTPLCPEVCLPKINYDNIISGRLYKGVYQFYIRYKINKYDYTQWYNFGYTIVLDKQTEKVINRKLTYNEVNKDFNGDELVGAFKTTSISNLLVNMSSNTDIADSAININIGHDNVLYNYFDLGIVCISNTYTKYFIKENIKLLPSNSIDISLDSIREEQFNISEYHNFYNVKNIININNKLYISNYNEYKFNNIDVSNINLSIKPGDVITNNVDNYTLEYRIALACGKSIEQFKFYFNSEYTYVINQRRADGVTTYTQEVYSSKYISQGGRPTGKFVNLAYYLYCAGHYNLIKPRINLTMGYVVHTPGYPNDLSKALVPQSYVFKDIDPFENFIFVSYPSNFNAEVMYDKKAYTGNVVVIANRFQIENAQNAINNKGDILKNSDTRTYYFTNPTEWESYKQGALGVVNYNYELDLSNSKKDFHYHRFNTILKIDGIDIPIVPTNNMNKDLISVNDNTTIDTTLNKYNITSLLQGEIYDFYIHFVNKYGEISDGFRLSNNNSDYKIALSGVETGKYGCMLKSINSDSNTTIFVFNSVRLWRTSYLVCIP